MEEVGGVSGSCQAEEDVTGIAEAEDELSEAKDGIAVIAPGGEEGVEIGEGDCGEGGLELGGEVGAEMGGEGIGDGAGSLEALEEFSGNVVAVGGAAAVAGEEEFATPREGIADGFGEGGQIRDEGEKFRESFFQAFKFGVHDRRMLGMRRTDEKAKPGVGDEGGISNLPYFSDPMVVEEYARAVADVGLWVSEEKIFARVFEKEDTLLELGCGAGRIAMGLWELGYRDVFATDISRAMVNQARALCQLLEYDVKLGVQDATQLGFADATFDGAIFGFNGLLMIPGRANRRRAVEEIARVIRPGGFFVFTGHDRELSVHEEFWAEELWHWDHGRQDPRLEIFGDRIVTTPEGVRYIHVTTVAEVEEWIAGSGFRLEATVMRSEVAQEPPEVERFSDETRFFVLERV